MLSSTPGSMSYSERRELERRLADVQRRKRRRKIDSFYPDQGPLRRELYPKHVAFFAAGADHGERGVVAANRVGKSEGIGAYEMALHLTGDYPHWWIGRRFDRPIDAIAAGDTGTTTRDIVQNKLLGSWVDKGTGMIPGDKLGRVVPKQGVAEGADRAYVRHVSGGWSVVQFRSYDQKREAFQGTERHVIWCDEEPPEDIYVECVLRTMTTKGIVLCTFTPLNGATDIVMAFLNEKGGKFYMNMTWDDAPHLSEEDKAAYLEKIPVHMRDARSKGAPMLGDGPIFAGVDEESLKCVPFTIPAHWVQLGGLDFGWDHPFAAVKLAWDRETDTVYITNAYREKHQTPIIHAAAIKPWGGKGDAQWLRWAWPKDGLQTEKSGGEALALRYREQGLRLLDEHATHDDGGDSVEAGIMDMLDRMKTGRFKVFAHLSEWFEEWRIYHRKKGVIVKLKDDLLSASRYALMMKRFARGAVEMGGGVRRPGRARGLD